MTYEALESEGFRWVRITIRKIATGDGSFRFYEEYSFGNQEVGGDLVSLKELAMRVLDNVALDWTVIEEHLESNDSWSTMIQIHEETAAQMFVD
jgi:hypothetical protein